MTQTVQPEIKVRTCACYLETPKQAHFYFSAISYIIGKGLFDRNLESDTISIIKATLASLTV